MEMRIRALVVSILLLTALVGCQAAATNTPGAAGNGQFAPNSDMQTRIASNPDMQTRVASGGGFRNGTRTPGGFGGQGGPGGQIPAGAGTPTAELQPTQTPTPAATATEAASPAVQTVEDYFAALEKGDFGAAAKLVSGFSLMAQELTTGDVTVALTEQAAKGAKWSDLQVKESQAFGDQTVLVHVQYTLTTTDAKTGDPVETSMDEQWPVRREYKNWLYNWNNLIDFKTLTYTTQYSAGLSMTPVQMNRYSDRISLLMLVQNLSNDTVVIGQTNQVLATFHFGSSTSDAVNTRYAFERMRSYQNVAIDIKGLYESYPDSVEIVKYINYKSSPWFTFSLNE